MRAVLAAALNRLQLLDLVEDVVVLRRRDAIQAAARPAVAHDVERAVVQEQPLRRGDLRGDPLDLRLLVGADLARRDADEPLAFLVAGDQPALVVGGEAHPRAEFVLRHGEQLLDLGSREA